MLGGTRGALLGYVASLFIAIFILFFRQGPLKARSLIVALAITIIALCSASLFDTARFGSIATIITEAGTGGTVSDASTNQRLAIYQGGVGSFLASPIYGHGWWRRFDAAFPNMPEVGRAAMAHDNHAHLHNEVLSFGSAAGFIEIFASLILMAAPPGQCHPIPRTANWPIRITAAVGLVVCYMAMGLVDTMLVFEIPKSMYVLCSAVIMAFFLDEPPQPRAYAKVTAN
jgi:O-antigen ligase